jgi:hypothetical protein
MIWLGAKRGYLSDWITQRWVQLTGKRVDLEREPWLQGPIGKTTGIGLHFFDDFAYESGLAVHRKVEDSGLMKDFSLLAASDFNPSLISPRVIDFYERTSNYEMDAWGEWCGVFRPFGQLLSLLFSRRIQQLNVPLTGLDTSQGMTSEVIQLIEPATGQIRYTAWVRQLLRTKNVLYAGSYSICEIPNREGACVKVVFPLPNGNAIVMMRPEAHEDGSFEITSSGSGFGDAGFYFTVRDHDNCFWVRYVGTLKESIRVYEAEGNSVRADHVLRIWGTAFLRLHYRLRPCANPVSELPVPTGAT